MFYSTALLQIPHNFLGHTVDILHSRQGGYLIFVEAAVADTSQIPGKMLSGLQTGDMLPQILLGQLNLGVNDRT